MAKPASFVSALVGTVKAELETLAQAQASSAKEKGWSFDPRAKINVEPSVYDLCVKGLNALDEIVDFHIKKHTYVLAAQEDADGNPIELPPATPLENYTQEVIRESENYLNMEEEEMQAVGINRLFEVVPASYVVTQLEQSGHANTSKDDVKAFLLDGLDMVKMIQDYPHVPYFSDVKKVQEADEDPRDAESSWCEKFENHMLWLFEQFDAQKCNTLGRIYALLGKKPPAVDDEDLKKEFQNLTLSRLGGTCFRKTEALAKKEDAKDEAQEAGNAGEDDEDDGAQGFLSQRKRQHVARHAILTYPFDYRTYVSVFAFNVRESDYDGSRSSIAGYVEDMAEEFFKPQEFVQVDALGGDVSEVDNVVTSAFYIPGLKEDLQTEMDEDGNDDGGEKQDEE